MKEKRWEKQLKECNKKPLGECKRIACEKCEMFFGGLYRRLDKS
ncbi:hypothetical protein LCGC14_0567100 [marine sediment metagenome]|uniref:Uncharacterized protein n=1 Tax=marine sediment metagenome TaxID=412755 RepID=A0A0F9UTM7_9ZZZZ